MISRRHNNGPPLETDNSDARLRAEIARLLETADRETYSATEAWRRRQPNATRRFGPSARANCPRDRALLAEAEAEAQHQALAKRRPQIERLRRKLARAEAMKPA